MASTSVPEIAYRFLADNAEALRVNKQTEQSVGKVTFAFLDLDKGVNKFFGSFRDLLPVLSATAIAGFAKSALEAADAVGDAADRAQLTVAQFSRLQYVAAQTDVNFEELTRAIKAFRIGMDDAENGTGNLYKGLDRLGLTIADLRDLNLEQQLQLIATRFEQVIDPTTRAGIAQDFFNKSGQAMIPLLARGGEGLANVAKAAEDLGQVYDDYAVKGADRFMKWLETVTKAGKVGAGNFFGSLIGETFGSGDAFADMEHKLSELKKRRDELSANPFIFGQQAAGELGLLNDEIAELEATVNRLRAQREAEEYSKAQLGRRRQELLNDEIQPFTPTVKKIEEENELIKAIRDAREQEERERDKRRVDSRVKFEAQMAEASIASERLVTAVTQEELDRRSEAEQRTRQQAISREEELREILTNFRRDTSNAAVTLLTAYGGKYKKFAQGILAIEKAHAIAKTIISTKAAAAAALELYGPTPWGYAAAAAAIAFGVAQVAAIASTFIGGGSSAAGSPHNPVFVDTAAQTPDTPTSLGTASAQGEQRVLQVIIQGNVYSGRETVDFLIQQLSSRINEYDAVVINPSSRQARELATVQT